jgi:glycosyltransferase involved in cell wall biosynthesis
MSGEARTTLTTDTPAPRPLKTQDELRLSVVVTVYTETRSVAETVRRLLLNDHGSIREILLVVHPGSSEATKQTCADLEAKCDVVRVHIQQQTAGVGWALREGMGAAREQAVCIMAGDLETEPEAVERMFQKMKSTGADVVLGNRWAPAGGFANYGLGKYLVNWIFQKAFRVIYATQMNDLTYGFKILRKRVIESINWESTFQEIFIETTVKPLRRGFHVEQVPTVWVGRTDGNSVKTFGRNLKYVALALKVRVS